jgi:hypothetical protein
VFWGGVAGAVIGHNSGSLGHNAWRGAAYGAGAGLVLGGIADRDYAYRTGHRVSPSWYYPRASYVYRTWPRYGYGAGYGYGYGRPYYGSYYYGSSYYGDRSYGYGYGTGRSNYAANGLFWGALTGAIIGNNSGSLGHNAWRGAGYGAAAGLLIGAIAENNARDREATAPVDYISSPAQSTVSAAPAPSVAPAPAVPAAPSTPMSSANSLFGRN